MEGFEEFWRVYPSRGRASNPKKLARGKFQQLLIQGVKAAEMIAGARIYAADCEAEGIDGTRMVCQAITFLNQERWADCLEGEIGRKERQDASRRKQKECRANMIKRGHRMAMWTDDDIRDLLDEGLITVEEAAAVGLPRLRVV